MMPETPSVSLPSGAAMPVLGQGTWHLGENPARRPDELAALRLGIDLGMTTIDTAEMYGDGAAEELVAEAVAGRRDEVFLVSKVLPDNASRTGTKEACHRSLRRLRTDRIDLYLLHWLGLHPLDETVEAFTELIDAGDIGQWGVSNFDQPDMEDLFDVDTGCAANQILYNVSRRGPEYALIPWCEERNVVVMAYSPIEQGRLDTHPALAEIAARHDATAPQVALAWTLRRPGMVAIPRSSSTEHVRHNRAALALRLTHDDIRAIDAAFPPPTGPRPLETL